MPRPLHRTFSAALAVVVASVVLAAAPAASATGSSAIVSAPAVVANAPSAAVVTTPVASVGTTPAKTDDAGGGWLMAGVEAALRASRARVGLLPGEMPDSAGGNLLTVPGSAEAPREAARTRTVRVQVEEGLPVDGAVFADYVMSVLNDPRGWGHDGSVVFSRTDGDAEISVVLASPALTDQLCVPLKTVGRYSCGRNGRAVLNSDRWSEGADPFLTAGGTLGEYREYLINHEVGHLLGRPHTGCPVPGQPAPVMVQQSITVGGCLPNGWPATAS